MSEAEREIVVEAPAAPAGDSPAVPTNRTADVVVSLLVLAFAAPLAYDNWRTGMGWDPTGPQGGYFPFYLSVFLAGAPFLGLAKAFLARKAAAGIFVTR